MATQQLAQTVPNIHELATIDERYRALVAQRETIARTLMPANATPVQVDAFLRLCSRYALDPFVGEAWAFPKPGGGIAFCPGYRAYLRLAQEHPDFELLRFGVVFKGEECRVNPASGEVHHVMGFEDCEPIAAWWQLKRKSQPPMAGRVLLKHVTRNTSAWKDAPVQMLRKAAIVEACMVGMGMASSAYARLEESDDDILDVAGLDVDEATGEILDTPGGVDAAIDNANQVAETPLEPGAAEAPPASGADDA